MNRQSAYFLILKYPPLASYIEEAYNREDYEEIMDLLFGLDSEDLRNV